MIRFYWTGNLDLLSSEESAVAVEDRPRITQTLLLMKSEAHKSSRYFRPYLKFQKEERSFGGCMRIKHGMTLEKFSNASEGLNFILNNDKVLKGEKCSILHACVAMFPLGQTK